MTAPRWIVGELPHPGFGEILVGPSICGQKRMPKSGEELILMKDAMKVVAALNEIEGLMSGTMGDGQRSPQVASRMDRALEIARVAQGKSPSP